MDSLELLWRIPGQKEISLFLGDVLAINAGLNSPYFKVCLRVYVCVSVCMCVCACVGVRIYECGACLFSCVYIYVLTLIKCGARTKRSGVVCLV